MDSKMIYESASVRVKHEGNALVFKHPSNNIFYGTLVLNGCYEKDASLWEAIAKSFREKESATIIGEIKPSKNKGGK
jgi:hypothetical protein